MKEHERLKILRKEELNLTQKELADILGIAPATYGMIETGRRTLRENYLKILETLYHVNPNWIVAGEGEMFIISPRQSELIDLFEQMSVDLQDSYVELGKTLLNVESGIKKEER